LVLAGLLGAGAVLFLAAGRRRRRRDDPDAPGTSPATGRLAAVGAHGGTLAMAPATAATASATDAALATADARVAGPIEPDESKMPRWRRPSLMQARRADVRLTDKREPIRFEDASIDTADRRLVRYDLARVTDGPSEVGTTELGLLGRGDEVLVLDRQGTYVRVRTPDGLEGWVHRTILSQFEAPAAPAGAAGLALSSRRRSRPPIRRDPIRRDPIRRDPIRRDPIRRDPMRRPRPTRLARRGSGARSG
jgi:hypothetical protein